MIYSENNNGPVYFDQTITFAQLKRSKGKSLKQYIHEEDDVIDVEAREIIDDPSKLIGGN